MIKLALGLILWTAAHFTRRLAPGLRRDLSAALGERIAAGLVALVIVAGAILIALGYWQAPRIDVYSPLPGAGWVANILMAVSLFLLGVGPAGGRLYARIRHPMLLGLITWSVAHLLANGDLASIVMFGGLGLWAFAEIRLINRHEGPWERPMPGEPIQDLKLGLAVGFIYFVIAGLHWLAGHGILAESFV